MTFRLPDPRDILVREVLQRNAQRWPDELFVTFQDGTTWTRREALEIACRTGHRLRAAGVDQGDRVAVALGNGPDFMRAWFGTAMLGAVLVPVNTAYRGSILAHLFRLAVPKILVSDRDTLSALAATGVPEISAAAAVDAADLTCEESGVPELARPVGLHDPVVLLMTSGTTGPSKLAVNTGLHTYLGGEWFVAAHGRGREDVLLLDLPLFHGAAFWWATTCLSTGTRMVIRSQPDLRAYWEIARDNGITMGLLLSTMVPFLLGLPEREAEHQHRIRAMVASPPPKDLPAFTERFRLAYVGTGYGLTEVPSPVVAYPGDAVAGSYCGRQRPGFECRLVDSDDIEVPVGEPGELIVRADHPWMITPGYVDNPEATARAWRGGWFHTGDMMRRDTDGRFFFVDRTKDAMRRRGENISSVELEGELRGFPGLAEVACVPYREEGSIEDEVKAWVVAQEGVQVEWETLLRFAVDRLPYFMVPRYFELTDELPKTPSLRVKKFELRTRGNSDNTWDREEHGFRVTRNGLTVGHGSTSDPTREGERG